MLPLWVLVIALLFLLAIGAGGLSTAPWVPTRRGEREALLKEITVTPGQTVYDLGCGNGVVLFLLARRQPAAQYIGYELALLPLAIGWVQKILGGRAYQNVHLRFGDFFGQSLATADIIFAFLLDTTGPRLAAKFYGGLKPEAIVVIEGWPIPGLTPEKKITAPRSLPLYVYRGEQFSVKK